MRKSLRRYLPAYAEECAREEIAGREQRGIEEIKEFEANHSPWDDMDDLEGGVPPF